MPQPARLDGLVDLPLAHGRARGRARALARWRRKNVAAGSVPFFIGGGAYRHHVPAAVDHLIQRGEFLTSYTPYQPELAQGTLQSLFEFQTQVALLTGMEVANASLYDGATACAEAVAMAHRVTRRSKAVLSGGLHPHYREVCETYAQFAGLEVACAGPAPGGGEDLAALIDGDTACVVVQNPDFFGELRDYSGAGGALPPGRRAARRRRHRDRVAGRDQAARRDGRRHRRRRGPVDRQRAQFRRPPCRAVRQPRATFVRQMPGRLVGQTVDADGRRGWVLTLSTREQHIRREKATSNICTNSGLCALAFTIHLALLGEAGLTRLARLNHAAAVQPRRPARGGARRAPGQRQLLQRIHPAPADPGGGAVVERWPRRACSAACRSAASIRTAPTSPTCCWSRRPRRRPRTTSTALRAALAEVLR